MKRALAGWAAAATVSCAVLAMPLVAYGATTTVSVKDFAFQPNATVIHAGDVVTWTNLDGTAHTATSVGVWDTGSMPYGASRSITFTTPGTYLYYCVFHSIMFGSIVVVPADEPLPAVVPTIAPGLLRGPVSSPLITVNTDTAPTLAPATTATREDGLSGLNLLTGVVFVAGVAALAWRVVMLSRNR